MSSTKGGTGLIPWRMGGHVHTSAAWPFCGLALCRSSNKRSRVHMLTSSCLPSHSVGRGVRRHLQKWPGKCPWLQVPGMFKVQFILVKARDQRKMQRSRHPWYPGVHVWKLCLCRQSKDRHTQMSHPESCLSSLMITDFLGYEFCSFQISHELFALRVSFLFLPLFVLV